LNYDIVLYLSHILYHVLYYSRFTIVHVCAFVIFSINPRSWVNVHTGMYF